MTIRVPAWKCRDSFLFRSREKGIHVAQVIKKYKSNI